MVSVWLGGILMAIWFQVFARFGQVDSWMEDDEGRARLIQMGYWKLLFTMCGDLFRVWLS